MAFCLFYLLNLSICLLKKMQLCTGLPSCSVRGGVALLPESTLFCGAERVVGPELELSFSGWHHSISFAFNFT